MFQDAATKASLVGSITVGATFLLSALAGILTDRFGIRKTAFFGGLLATLGMLLSSFFVDRVRSGVIPDNFVLILEISGLIDLTHFYSNNDFCVSIRISYCFSTYLFNNIRPSENIT